MAGLMAAAWRDWLTFAALPTDQRPQLQNRVAALQALLDCRAAQGYSVPASPAGELLQAQGPHIFAGLGWGSWAAARRPDTHSRQRPAWQKAQEVAAIWQRAHCELLACLVVLSAATQDARREVRALAHAAQGDC